MFDQPGVRKVTAIGWIIVFVILIGIYYYTIQPFKQEAMAEINSLEKSIVDGDWQDWIVQEIFC